MQAHSFEATLRPLSVNKSEIRALGLEPIISDEVVLLAPLPQFWTEFTQAFEYADGKPDPLDRYSKRVIGALANALGVEAFFPSDGPPFAPFIQWAMNAEGVYLSPIGLLVHDEFGLLISFRGALKIKGEAKRASKNPCRNCAAPCVNACPVNAFQDGDYILELCKSHLSSGDVACWQGCLARLACPANKIKRDPAQSAFSMRAFMGRD